MSDDDTDLREAVRLVNEHGGVRQAARASGINRSTLRNRYARAKQLGLTGDGAATEKTIDGHIADIIDELDAPLAAPNVLPERKIAAIDAGLGRALALFGKGNSHAVVGDVHAVYGQDLGRCWAAGSFIADVQPAKVVQLGDLFDMPSLSAYENSKLMGGGSGPPTKRLENKRYVKDLEAGDIASNLLTGPTLLKNKFLKPGEEPYTPRFVWCEGNHEDRIRRAVNIVPQLEGFMGPEDITELLEIRGWETHRFLDPVEIDGVFYAHYFLSGVKRLPIGGENSARKTLKTHHVSCVWGHSHAWGHAEEATPRGKIAAINAGCLIDLPPTQASSHCWSGLTLLYGVDEGRFEHAKVPLWWLYATYGSGK